MDFSLKRFYLLPLMFFIFFLLHFSLYAEETAPISNIESIDFKGADAFPLKATLYKGDPKAPGVMLLHDCSHDSRSYAGLGRLLSDDGLNVLALDLRGYGASTTDTFSQKIMKQKSKDIVAYQGQMLMLQSYWNKDVLTAYNIFQQRLAKGQGISVIASGCSVNQAVVIAESFRVNSFALISPIMDYMEKERYKNLIDIPTFFVSSIHDAASYATTKELYMWNGDERSLILTYKGNRQGNSLMNGKRHLTAGMALWVEKHLHHRNTEK